MAEAIQDMDSHHELLRVRAAPLTLRPESE